MPAHVTVLFPFAAREDLDEGGLETLFARYPPFDFTLDRIGRFEDGTRWLRPNPPTTFVDLTAAVCARWPECPPYQGAFDEIIPHVTITADGDLPLPIACRALEVALFEEDDDGVWSQLRSFAFQGVA
jgi:2'-5' RNA ligase superfamily